MLYIEKNIFTLLYTILRQRNENATGNTNHKYEGNHERFLSFLI